MASLIAQNNKVTILGLSLRFSQFESAYSLLLAFAFAIPSWIFTFYLYSKHSSYIQLALASHIGVASCYNFHVTLLPLFCSPPSDFVNQIMSHNVSNNRLTEESGTVVVHYFL